MLLLTSLGAAAALIKMVPDTLKCQGLASYSMNTYIFMVEKRRPIYLTGQRYVLQNWQECHQTCPRCNVGEILACIVCPSL